MEMSAETRMTDRPYARKTSPSSSAKVLFPGAVDSIDGHPDTEPLDRLKDVGGYLAE